MYAIIETGGKQYRVQEGDKIVVEKLAVEEGQEVAFERVLTVVKDGEVLVGAPVVAGAKVVAKVRAKRAMAPLCKIGPMAGILSTASSTLSRTICEFRCARTNKNTPPTMAL